MAQLELCEPRHERRPERLVPFVAQGLAHEGAGAVLECLLRGSARWRLNTASASGSAAGSTRRDSLVASRTAGLATTNRMPSGHGTARAMTVPSSRTQVVTSPPSIAAATLSACSSRRSRPSAGSRPSRGPARRS